MFKVIILLVVGIFPVNIIAASSDYGRPWDNPDYHSSPIGILMVPFTIIILIVLGIGWISGNKDKVIKLLKISFYFFCGGALVFGLIILPLLDRLERKSNENQEINYTTSINNYHTGRKPSSDNKKFNIDVEKEKSGREKIPGNFK